MNNDLLELKNRVNDVIYNPFVNLKDRAKEIKTKIAGSDKYNEEVKKLDAAITSLDEFESLPYGNLERIKGFNKTKNTILKIVKGILDTP